MMIDKILIRFADILLSLLGLVVLFIPMLVIGLFIWLEDRGPIFFRQARVGQNSKIFKIYKFRSMRIEPQTYQGTVTTLTREEMLAARARFKTTRDNDPRITRMGKLLRASHLDEMPQLLNVLQGNMSLVGVRPDTPVQEVDYSPEYWQRRHQLRPGITGLAQLKSDTATLDKRTELELLWLDRPSFVIYIKTLALTFLKVLKRTGN